jgi:hypothetical protein
MRINKLKIKYRLITLIVLTIVVWSIGIYYDLDLKLYHFVFKFIISILLADLIYNLFSGILTHKASFIGHNNENNQMFVLDLQMGISKHYKLEGCFDNSIGLKEDDLAQLFFEKVNRDDIRESVKYGKFNKLVLDYRGELITVYIGIKEQT